MTQIQMHVTQAAGAGITPPVSSITFSGDDAALGALEELETLLVQPNVLVIAIHRLETPCPA